MNITREQLEQLTRIYNTLLEVPTKGEGSFIMTDALRALEQVIIEISKTAQQAQQPMRQEVQENIEEG